MGTFVLPHLTSRLSVGSWPPKLPRSAFDAHWPPLEARYLEYIRVASSGGICPLTCAKVGAERGAWVSAINAAIAGAVAAAEYTTALSIAPGDPPLDPPPDVLGVEGPAEPMLGCRITRTVCVCGPVHIYDKG